MRCDGYRLAGRRLVSVNGVGTNAATVTVIPGSGGSMSVEYTTSPNKKIADGTATWVAWPLGTVVSRTSDVLVGRIPAVRAVATTAAGTLEVAQ